MSKLAGLFLFVALLFWCAGTAKNARAQDAGNNDTKSSLRSQLNEVQAKIDEYQNSIQQTSQQQKSLSREISLFDKEVGKQILQIKKINLDLLDVEESIKDNENSVGKLEVGLKERKALLNISLQKLNEYDNANWVSIMLRGGNLSDFFNQVRYLRNIQNEINDFITNIDQMRQDLEDEKSNLEDKKLDIIRLKGLNALQQISLERKRKEKADLLSQTKGQEKLFTEALKRSKKDVQFIKQQLFTLESVGVSMSFEEAYKKARFASDKTGIRPAFLLAIFQVESKLGTYVGGGSWRVDMKPQERPLFLQITSRLSLDPDTMPVSKRPWYGWGGAMGAAQFIPSTWMIYESQVASLTGHNPPSPWNIEDAFIISSLKLSSNGANSRAYEDERSAAAKYLAGGRYKTKVAREYADAVMDWAGYYQDQVDAINETGSSAITKQQG